MSDEREFKFKAEYPEGHALEGERVTVRVKGSYDSRLMGIELEKWDKQNPRPAIPFTVERVSWANDDGYKEITEYQENDIGYRLALAERSAKRNDFLTAWLHDQVDIDSIDAEILEFAKWRTGIDADIEAFLLAVAKPREDDTENEKGETVAGYDEIQGFYAWMQEVGNTSEALIERDFAAFRSRHNGQAGQNAEGVGVGKTEGRKKRKAGKDDASAAPDSDGSRK